MNRKIVILIAAAAVAAVIAAVFLLSSALKKDRETEQPSRPQNSFDSTISINSSGSDIPETDSSSSSASASEPSVSGNGSSSDDTHSSVDAPETSGSSNETSSYTSTSSDTQSGTSSEEEPPPETSDDSPAWTETEMSAELYVNSDRIYSRLFAIQGSDTVREYRLNDKVTVVAKTDTNYYKLDDGTFIHCDYLSETEAEIHNSGLADYTSTTPNGYTIERRDSITYVDGIMIANKTYTLPSSYDPGTMPDAYEAFLQMQDAASADGINLYIVSGYRSYYDQEAIYARYVYNDGVENADTYSSRPGHSDHQTGYTFDLNSLSQSFADTAEGIWLAEHCADFGFIIRYPKGKDAYTGYMYEPWHVRYIGVEKAGAITASGLSLEEYYGITSDYADSQNQ